MHPVPAPKGRHRAAASRPESFGSLMGAVLGAALLPGSVYLRLGRCRLGRTVLALWLLLIGALLGGLAFVVVTRDLRAVTAVLVQPDALRAALIAAAVVGVLWLGLLLDQFRLLRPFRRPVAHRLAASFLFASLVAGGALPLGWAAQAAEAQRDLLETVFPSQPEATSFSSQERAQRPDGRLNVLLLGGDSGDNRVGTRADSILVASVDRRTGKTVLVSLPRNLQRAPFPAGSPMAQRFPQGFDDLLNAVYTYGERNPGEFPGARNPGAEAMTQAVSAITGLPIDYYTFVNLAGFREVVDAVGGITVRVDDRVPIGGKTDDNGRVVAYPSGWIEPGVQHLDGYHALWYARGRFGSDDYQRMRRQRCVVGALLDQSDPQQLLRNYPQLAKSAKNLVDTNVPRTALPELAEIALDARDQSVVSVALTGSVINTATPDFAKIRRLVARETRSSTASPQPRPSAATEAQPSAEPESPAGTSTPTATAAPQSGQAEDVTDDLSSVCRYS